MNGSNDNHSTNSHVESRIPNLTGFKQRKIIGKPKEGNILPPDCGLKKCNDHLDFLDFDVCLRVKPKTNNYPNKQNTLTILSDNTVACSNGNSRDGVTEYTFSSVYGPNVNQKTFFNSWVHDKVSRFLNGYSELLLAYGTTNAGKTYTIHGNLNNPGIIPRTLSLIFSTLDNKLMSQCKYKPAQVNVTHILDDNLMKAEEDIRNSILNNWSNEKFQDEHEPLQEDKSKKMYSFDQLTNKSIAKMFDGIKNYEKVFLDHGDVFYTVWVSYAEIYNESIYDLLISYSVNQKRIPLKLSLDKHKDAYVRDLTHVFVKSAEEAYKIISFGRNNLKIASNNLNKLSNRSHCIFTIKLMRIENKKNPETAVISSITFCDLAGSERLKKTMNIGDRLTESKNINTSLLVLNKCFSVLRENKKRGENHVVPFRESKLTQMFQAALIGNTRSGISMTINVDVSFGLFDETKQVLIMSSIVHSITKNKGKKNSKSRPSFTVSSLKNRKFLSKSKYKQNLINDVDESIDESKIKEKLMITEKDFKIKLEEEQVKLRKDLISQFQTILNNNNTFHKNQKEIMIKKKTKMYEDKIERIRGYHLEEIQEIKNNLKSNPDLRIQHVTTQYTNQIENYKFRINELEMQKQKLLAEIYILKNVQDIRHDNIYSKNQENEALSKEANFEYKHLEADINEITLTYDESYQELEEKNLEISKFASILDVKDNITPEIKNHLDEFITEECTKAEQKLLQHINEKLEVNVGLEKTTKILKNEEEKSETAEQYQIMNQKHLNRSKTQSSNDSLLNSKLTGTTDLCGKSLDEDIVEILINIRKRKLLDN